MKKSVARGIILGVLIASVNFAGAQSGGLSESSLKVAEINRRIDEQSFKNRTIANQTANSAPTAPQQMPGPTNGWILSLPH